MILNVIVGSKGRNWPAPIMEIYIKHPRILLGYCIIDALVDAE
jgi:hypothetical protein